MLILYSHGHWLVFIITILVQPLLPAKIGYHKWVNLPPHDAHNEMAGTQANPSQVEGRQ